MMPRQKPTESRQDYETPPDFLAAVKRLFGVDFDVDLACSYPTQTDMFLPDNRKAPLGLAWPTVDSLTVPWAQDYGDCVCWLNPPFKSAAEFAAKCALEIQSFGDRGMIFLLTPASVSSNWYADHVWGRALTFAIRPRLVFVGETDPFPKDLILNLYTPDVPERIALNRAREFDLWRWREDVPHAMRRRKQVEDIDSL